MKTNYAAGHSAEKKAAEYLMRQGFRIRGINWKTRYCEIDIVAEKSKTIHFIEVKYRLSDSQGKGFDYITPRKLRQMRFAANMWTQQNSWAGDYCLGAIEISGGDFKVDTFVYDWI